jgi:hypothetical protein
MDRSLAWFAFLVALAGCGARAETPFPTPGTTACESGKARAWRDAQHLSSAQTDGNMAVEHLGIDESGNAFVTMSDNHFSRPGRMQFYGAAAQAWGEAMAQPGHVDGLAMLGGGDAMLIWNDDIDQWKLLARRYQAATATWTDDTVVAQGEAWPLVSSASGDALLLWLGGSNDFNTSFYDHAAAGWTSSAQLPVAYSMNEVRLVMNRQGDAVLAWEQPDASGPNLYAIRWSSTDKTWQPVPVPLGRGEATAIEQHVVFDVALRDDGTALAVFLTGLAGPTTTLWLTQSAASSWDQPVAIASVPFPSMDYARLVTNGSSGTVVGFGAVATRGTPIRLLKLRADKTWVELPSPGDWYIGDAALDSAGNFMFLPLPSNVVVARRFDAGTSLWDPPVALVTAAGYATGRLAMAPCGQAMATIDACLGGGKNADPMCDVWARSFE